MRYLKTANAATLKGMKRSCLCALLLLATLLTPAAQAQSREVRAGEAAEETRVAQEGLITGALDDDTPFEVFAVEGLRGEVIGFDLRVTGGSLDPILTVFDESGRLALRRDDSASGNGAAQDLAIEASGRYFVVVGRFGYRLGSSAGSYELRMTRKGVLSERGSALRYGDSVIGTISDAAAEVYYTFQAQQGDILTITMLRSSGTLDPFLRVVDSDRFLIAENDDQAGADTRNARLDSLVIDRAGTYIIIATRYDDSAGSFVLSIEEAPGSGSGSARLAPLPIDYGETKQSSISHEQYERFYSFEAAAADLVTISMTRGESGNLDSFITLADAEYRALEEDDDDGGEQNARISDYRIPAAGRYHIIATRYEKAQGKTSGRFSLRLELAEDPAVEPPPGTLSLDFGSSVTGKISADNEADIYALYGRRGERVTAAMTRMDGDLDPYLELLDAAQTIVTTNDDGGNGQNALINSYPLPASGTYYLRARRYSGDNGNPDTSGAYVLVLAESPG